MVPPWVLVDRPMADPGVEACQRFSGICESPASCCLNRRQGEYALGVAQQVSHVDKDYSVAERRQIMSKIDIY